MNKNGKGEERELPDGRRARKREDDGEKWPKREKIEDTEGKNGKSGIDK